MKNFLNYVTALVFLLASANALADYNIDKTFDTTFSGELVLDTDVGSIDIRTHDHQEIQVNISVTGSDAEDFSVDIIERENGLEIQGKRTSGGSSFWSWGKKLRVSFELVLPTRYDVSVKTAGGPVKVAGLDGNTRVKTAGGSLNLRDIKGRVEGKTSGGPIDVSNIAGSVRIKTSGGPVSAHNIIGDIEAKTSGGPISLNDIRGNTDANTSGGPIDIGTASASYEINAHTSGGSIKARFIDEVQQDIELSTSGGSVTVYFPAGSAMDIEARGSYVSNELGQFEGSQSKRKLDGKINGGGPRVSLRTSGGKISINKL